LFGIFADGGMGVPSGGDEFSVFRIADVKEEAVFLLGTLTRLKPLCFLRDLYLSSSALRYCNALSVDSLTPRIWAIWGMVGRPFSIFMVKPLLIKLLSVKINGVNYGDV
jgi:hypothetical protein